MQIWLALGVVLSPVTPLLQPPRPLLLGSFRRHRRTAVRDCAALTCCSAFGTHLSITSLSIALYRTQDLRSSGKGGVDPDGQLASNLLPSDVLWSDPASTSGVQVRCFRN